MSAEPIQRPSPAHTVAGFLAAMAIFVALIGIAWHPVRLLAAALVLSLVSAGMAPRGSRLPTAAVFITAACVFVGLTVAVVTERPLW